jgi:predicted Zn finger-like uncharacterized protein
MLVTRCPACLKAFKVVKDQLKLSQGWVRCGHCSEVFHAATHFVQRPEARDSHLTTPTVRTAPTQESAVVRSFPSEKPDTPNTSDQYPLNSNIYSASHSNKYESTEQIHTRRSEANYQPPIQKDQLESDLPQTLFPEDGVSESRIAQGEDWDSVWPLPAADSSHSAMSVDSETHIVGVNLQEQVIQTNRLAFTDSELRNASRIMTRSASDLREEEEQARAVDVARASVLIDTSDPAKDDRKLRRSKHAKSRSADGAQVSATARTAQPGFVRAADRVALWRSTPIRAALSLILIAGLAMAALQAAFYFREALVLRWPESKPYLAMLCEHAGCRLEPVQRIDAVAIESSSLVKQGDDLYELNLMLRNQLPLANRMPHIELTLQDLAGMPVTRKVIEPKIYAASPNDIAIGIAARGEYRAILRISAEGTPVLGFKLDLFFPD